ncbi:MAG TPA: hypothetical protein VN840_07025 [Streptosporangiaceae bacterium]|nr:hypothetical protein [Streptosporangiaceae bacterium]
MAADPTRRVVLTAAAAVPVLLAGCKGVGALAPLPGLAPDVVALDHAIAAEQLMVVRYQAALDALTSKGKEMTVIRALLGEHQEHLDQLRGRLILPPRLATASPGPTPTAPPLAGDGQLLADLAAAEQAASARLLRQLLEVPPALAQLMASIGASEAAHAVLLARAGKA